MLDLVPRKENYVVIIMWHTELFPLAGFDVISVEPWGSAARVS